MTISKCISLIETAMYQGYTDSELKEALDTILGAARLYRNEHGEDFV